MNMQGKIKNCLRAAPKPPVPDGLLDRLRADVAVRRADTHVGVVRRWFAPTGGAISRWRVAAAAAIVIMILLSLSYGGVKVIQHLQHYTTLKHTIEYPQDNAVYTWSRSISSHHIQSEEEARRKEDEFYELYKKGKAEEIKPGVWSAILSDGRRFNFGGDPEMLGLSEAERKELLKKRFDEIHELKKAGKFEKIYKPERDFVIDGVKYRYFEACYKLSDGTVERVGGAERVKDGDQEKN